MSKLPYRSPGAPGLVRGLLTSLRQRPDDEPRLGILPALEHQRPIAFKRRGRGADILERLAGRLTIDRGLSARKWRVGAGWSTLTSNMQRSSGTVLKPRMKRCRHGRVVSQAIERERGIAAHALGLLPPNVDRIAPGGQTLAIHPMRGQARGHGTSHQQRYQSGGNMFHVTLLPLLVWLPESGQQALEPR